MSKLNEFISQKIIQNALGKDMAYERQSKSGLNVNTMVIESNEVNKPTFYQAEEVGDTSYIVIPEDILNEIDEKTSTNRENFEAKNLLFNSLVTASAIAAEGELEEDEDGNKNEITLEDLSKKEPTLDFDILKKIGIEKEDFFKHEVFKKGQSKPSGGVLETEETGEDKDSEDNSEEKEKEETENQLKRLKGSMVDDEGESYDSYFDSKNPQVKPGTEYEKEVILLTKRLASKLKGNHGVSSKITPSKKLNVRNIVRKSPYIYKKKNDLSSGKHTSINLIIDCSGSMGGKYIRNASAIATIINNIATDEKSIKGNVILSSANEPVVIPLGNGFDKLINTIQAFSSSEGLEKTMTKHSRLLAKSKYNICISDAQLTDKTIHKAKYEAQNIFIEGIYIGRTSNADDHITHMDEYFSRSSIHDNIDDTIEYIINVMLRG